MAYQKQLLVVTIAALLAAGALFYMQPSIVDDSTNESLMKEKLQCVSRQTMISRGQNWVDKHVPYSQSKTYDGYRTDCSGFVSMCWELSKPGLTTFTMHTVAHNITKAELQPGDAMNCDSHHIVLFAGWTSSDRTHYVAMEEANTAEGTVKKVIPYPYFNGDNCFHPIRYNSVC